MTLISKSTVKSTTYCMHFRKGRRGKIEQMLKERSSKGTTITISGVFWNHISLRRFQEESPVVELERMWRGLVALVLSRPGLRLSLRDDTEGKGDMVLKVGRQSTRAQMS